MELADIIRTIAGQKKGAVSRGIAGAFFTQGVIEQVIGAGGLVVNTDHGTVTARAVTDEPLEQGMRVWVSSTASKTTWLVHGAVR
jgi:hypothetical protein